MSGLHISRFIDKIKMFEAKNAKTFTMSIRDAKDLHADITKLLIGLQVLQAVKPKVEPDEVQQIEISGGGFIDK